MKTLFSILKIIGVLSVVYGIYHAFTNKNFNFINSGITTGLLLIAVGFLGEKRIKSKNS